MIKEKVGIRLSNFLKQIKYVYILIIIISLDDPDLSSLQKRLDYLLTKRLTRKQVLPKFR